MSGISDLYSRITPKLGINLKYFAIYLIFIITVAITPFWKQLDWEIYGFLNQWNNRPAMSDKIRVLDLPYSKDKKTYRASLTDLLKGIAGLPKHLQPDAVMMDIWTSREPEGLDSLITALNSLREQGIKVYAALNPWKENQSGAVIDPMFMDRHAADIYLNILDGFGHTQLDAPAFFPSALKYDAFLEYSGQKLPALVIKVYEDMELGAQWNEDSNIMINTGIFKDFQAITWRFKGSGILESYANSKDLHTLNMSDPIEVFADRYVIIGSLEKDVIAGFNRPGPEMIAWALSDLLKPVRSQTDYKLLSVPGLLLGMILVFSLISLLVSANLRHVFRKRSFRLWVAGLGSAVLSIGLLIVAVWLMFFMGLIYPQISLVITAILITVSVNHLRSRSIEVKDAIVTDLDRSKDQEETIYDLFISYSRDPENLKWVIEHIYNPLTEVRKIDGSRLNIFFDKKSIESGTSWYSKLAVAIEESRYFIPVYTDDYFDKPFCRFEMEKAAIKRVSIQDFIHPVARVIRNIPTEYDHIQFVDVSERPDFMVEIIQKISRE
jgi:hypothetical protein